MAEIDISKFMSYVGMLGINIFHRADMPIKEHVIARVRGSRAFRSYVKRVAKKHQHLRKKFRALQRFLNDDTQLHRFFTEQKVLS